MKPGNVALESWKTVQTVASHIQVMELRTADAFKNLILTPKYNFYVVEPPECRNNRSITSDV